MARVVAGQPYADLGDFWTRARVSRPVTERLVLAGAFDALHGMGGGGLGRRGRVTRRDLLLHVAELERWERGGGAAPRSSRRLVIPSIAPPREVAGERVDVRERAAAQSQAAREVVPAAEQPTQLTLDLGDRPQLAAGAGLPEMTGPERVRAELDVLGLDVRAHVVDFYAPLLDALGVTRSRDLLAGPQPQRGAGSPGSRSPPRPRRSAPGAGSSSSPSTTPPGRPTAPSSRTSRAPTPPPSSTPGCCSCAGCCAAPATAGVSIRATGAWELAALWDAWQLGGLHRRPRPRSPPVRREAAGPRRGGRGGAARGRRGPHRPPGARARLGVQAVAVRRHQAGRGRPALGSRGTRPVVVPEAPAAALPSRKLWHASPGSSGH